MSLDYNSKEKLQGVQTADLWNNWTFRGDFNGNIDLEGNRKTFNYNVNLRADQVTEDWKIRNSGRMSVRTREYLKSNQNSMRSCRMDECIIKYYVNEVNAIRKALLFYRRPALLA